MRRAIIEQVAMNVRGDEGPNSLTDGRRSMRETPMVSTIWKEAGRRGGASERIE